MTVAPLWLKLAVTGFLTPGRQELRFTEPDQFPDIPFTVMAREELTVEPPFPSVAVATTVYAPPVE